MKKNKKSTKIDEKKSKLQYNRCTLKGEVYRMERLQKRIATSGYCSRRKAEELIQKGLVEVNGEVITKLGTTVKPGDIKTVEGNILDKSKAYEYYLLNKPQYYFIIFDI